MLPKRYRLKRRDFANTYTPNTHIQGVSHGQGVSQGNQQSSSSLSYSSTRSNSNQYSGRFLKLRVTRLPEQIFSRTKCSSNQELRVGSSPKFGIVISKKVAKRAVLRNRLRRQIRAILFTLIADIESELGSKNRVKANQVASLESNQSYSLNLIVTVFPFVVQPSFTELRTDLIQILQKTKLIGVGKE